MSERIIRGQIEFEITGVNEHEAEGEMLIAEGVVNSLGSVQAGALIWFADVVAMSLVLGGEQPQEGMDNFPVALTLNAHLLANRREGHLVARARWVLRGQAMSTVRTEVRDDAGQLLLDLTSTHVNIR
ncbi:PaaI family thioesterase [Paracoccus nototheniae]|uniref:PaaI family thioesterase n=1 Tax=Paracoccus nototheniae TaxID=2489002 RepID=A0ABW4E2A0_9RHOB|nr:PaaI family thioesterase [Paracoccus nototheniae]